MSYLADTTYLIDLVAGDEGAVKLAHELDAVDETVYISVITVEEYLRGIYYLYWENKRMLKRKLMEAKRDLSAFEILPVTYEIAVKASEIEVDLIKRGEAVSLADLIIAATAMYHNLVLITRNVRYFKRIGKLVIRSY